MKYTIIIIVYGLMIIIGSSIGSLIGCIFGPIILLKKIGPGLLNVNQDYNKNKTDHQYYKNNDIDDLFEDEIL